MTRLSLLASLLGAALVQAAGFRSDSHAARAMAMGNAATALTADPSAIWYNPAGIVQGKGLALALGDTLTLPAISFQSDASGVATGTEFTLVYPPHVYATWGITEHWTVGLGLFVPFGSQGNWPVTWEGRFDALRSKLQLFDVNPTVAWQAHRRLKVGVGVQVVRGTVEIERAVNLVNTEAAIHLGGGAWGLGFNAGVQGILVEQLLTVGATFRSQAAMHFTGGAHFERVPPEFQSTAYDQPITADITLPNQASLGIGLTPRPNLRLALDATWVQWSQFKELKIAFKEDSLTRPLAKNWRDTVSLHAGGEYDVTAAIPIRLGFIYDPTPSPADTLTPDLPDATRLKFSVGAGYRKGPLTVDLGYQFVWLMPAPSASALPGTYSGSAQVVSLTLGYRFQE